MNISATSMPAPSPLWLKIKLLRTQSRHRGNRGAAKLEAFFVYLSFTIYN